MEAAVLHSSRCSNAYVIKKHSLEAQSSSQNPRNYITVIAAMKFIEELARNFPPPETL